MVFCAETGGDRRLPRPHLLTGSQKWSIWRHIRGLGEQDYGAQAGVVVG
jgi:hypothetical protein